MKTWLYISPSPDGRRNLAVDEYFLDHTSPEDMLLHFYINENAVIIGRGQNPWRECRLDAMQRDGVQLVRRITGGGAVFHDAGNLNFSFITGEAVYSVPRQLEMLMRALRALGIPCEASGRNDMLANGRKFSGNAFCRRGGIWQHHGTLLVDADLTRLPSYLNVDPRKLASKGVRSVSSRVCNLSELAPGLTVPALLERLTVAFAEEYGSYTRILPGDLNESALAPYLEKQDSDKWVYGSYLKADIELSERFPWGGIELLLSVRDGMIADASVYSDANDAELPAELRRRLLRQPCTAQALSAALLGDPRPELADVSELLRRSLPQK